MAEGSSGGGGDRGKPGGAGGDPLERYKISTKHEGKVCKGCLYYSSRLRSKGHMPHCVGISKSFQRVPDSLVKKYEIVSAEESRSVSDFNFKYACFGYSMFLHDKDAPTEKQEEQAGLPFCVGIKLLMDRTSVASQVPAHVHSKEDVPVHSQPAAHKPQQSSGDFFSKFNRNAGLVAYGVARNLLRVGYAIKSNLEDVLYPERRRPK